MSDIQQEMPKYNCTKKVHALKIHSIQSRDDESIAIHFEDSSFQPLILSSEDQAHKPIPEEGWYYVVYRDGYMSFSPASEFEDGYGLILKDEAEGDVVNADFYKTQDPKYVIIGGMLCNAFTKEPIPEDEPVFMLRAKDIHAYSTLDFYYNRCADAEHKKGIEDRMVEFDEFKSQNDDLMNEPDTLSASDMVGRSPEETTEGDNTSL